jgi:hypothetical protein
MKSKTGSAGHSTLLGAFCVLLVGLSVFPIHAEGQQGNNAVYNYNSITNMSQCCNPSPAFIDASMFAGSFASPDFCSVHDYVLVHVVQPTYPGGAVIDARGLPGTTSTSMTCAASPWAGITNPPPSTILLPATGSGSSANPIVISTTWILPSNTHLVGEGDGPSGTTIQRASGASLTAMIQFGSSSLCSSGVCTGIAVENLTLDGQAQSLDGIVNQYAQNNSYVNHVRIYQVLGTGLLVSSSGSSSAANSGPYSNITFDTGGYSGATSTVCVQILSVTGGTRGIHGLRCTSETNDAPAAVLLDSSNNSIEDVAIVGFYDGILVGSNAPAQSNILVNIIGDTTNPCYPSCATPINTVHISNNSSGGTRNVIDLSVAGASNDGSGTFTIADDLTSTYLSDAHLAIYALGESSIGGSGYSRYTTSPNAAAWVVGSGAPPSGACVRGSLYSCIGGSTSCIGNGSTYALWDCVPSGSTTVWTGVR